MENVVTFSLAQSDHIKRLLLYLQEYSARKRVVESNLLFVTSGSVKALSALAKVVRHCAEPAVLAVSRTGSIPTIRPAEPVRARAYVVSDAEAAVFTFGLARN